MNGDAFHNSLYLAISELAGMVIGILVAYQISRKKRPPMKYYLVTTCQTMIVSRTIIWDTTPVEGDPIEYFISLSKKGLNLRQADERKYPGIRPAWEMPVLVSVLEITQSQYQELKTIQDGA